MNSDARDRSSESAPAVDTLSFGGTQARDAGRDDSETRWSKLLEEASRRDLCQRVGVIQSRRDTGF